MIARACARLPRLAAAAALVAALAGCAVVREPLSATVAGIRPLEVGLLEQRFAVTVRVLNPNDFDIAFDGVVFDLELNGKPFARGVANDRGTIPRFGEALIEVNVVSGLAGVLRQIREVQAGREKVAYRLSGRLSAGPLGTVPFDTKGELRLPRGLQDG